MFFTVAWVCWMNYAPHSLATEAIEAIDLPSLANLLDPSQEVYLLARLRLTQVFIFRLLRLFAARIYFKRASHNAAVLIAVGRKAAKASDPQIALAGRNLERAALLVRIYAPLALLTLAGVVLLPGSSKLPAKIFAKRYAGLKHCIDRFVGLEQDIYPRVRFQS